MSIKNASTLPKVYYGLHFAPGVAEYAEPGKEPYRIMIGEEAIKNMDPTFQGRPVYVRHVENVDLSDLQAQADGYVIESFFNQADGKHWAKFIIVSDRGHEAIRSGWKLSNAYKPKTLSGGGIYQGVSYEKEVMSGEFEHLAVVPNPRYESKILTPEQFKQYNSDKQAELHKIANSKGERPMLSFWKKQKVENTLDLEQMTVALPKSKKEISLVQLINDADQQMQQGCYANGDHKVKVGEDEMTVNELVEKHMAMKQAMAPKEKEEAEMPKEDSMDKPADPAPAEEPKKNEEDEKKKADMKAPEEKKQNDDKAEKEKADASMKNAHFKALKNAPNVFKQTVGVDLASDKVARGKAKYGSGK